ncbi:hypothetical protein DFH11DRAFT_1544676 [Phellopilus nigrolimitatus]|nr:hypothetical protein DFH11DRAFT_1544676 [Phellopilus nigrolimitatus]
MDVLSRPHSSPTSTTLGKCEILIDLITHIYADLHFACLEINPLIALDDENGAEPIVQFLDMAVKLDQTSESICGHKLVYDQSVIGADRGPPMVWPAPFGRQLTKEEAYIRKLDGSTGASLKLTVLNPEGRVWAWFLRLIQTLGGGASVVYSDAIAAHGFSHELASYGEYSGTLTEGHEYVKTIIARLAQARWQDPHHWWWYCQLYACCLIFKGIICALKEYKAGLRVIAHSVKIFVHRSGPNYQEGFKAMHFLGKSLGSARKSGVNSARSIPPSAPGSPPPGKVIGVHAGWRPDCAFLGWQEGINGPWFCPFDAKTRSLVYGLQPRATQGMLDFDYSCGRDTPSVAAMIYPFSGHHIQKFYWGTKAALLLVYTSVEEAVKKHPDADVFVNFAPSRSVYSSTLDIMRFSSQIKKVAIIAEGVPERHAREILHLAKEEDILIVDPTTVGGIKAGCFKVCNSGGMMDNIIASKLYRAGSVGYVSKSGGMFNELNNILLLVTNSTYEGIAIGGDRYPGSTFIDHLLRYEADPDCKMLVLLGEVGGIEEYRVIDAVKLGKVRKPIIAWAIGTCAKMFATEVQFRRAGSMANLLMETVDTKNAAMKAARIVVPETFEDLPDVLRETYNVLVARGAVRPKLERKPPVIPMDYKWAQELGLVRKPAALISMISDERGHELLYAGTRITVESKEDIGLGGVVSSLWFKRRLMAPRPPSTSGLKCVHLCGCLFRSAPKLTLHTHPETRDPPDPAHGPSHTQV